MSDANQSPDTSRLPGFHKCDVRERRERLAGTGRLSAASVAHLAESGFVPTEALDRMSENVVASHCLPFSVATNFRVNQRDVLVPMAVEEPSIVAAASNAARIVRISGGFFGDADPPVMTAQVELHDVRDPAAAVDAIEAARVEILALADASIPRMVSRGGGARDLDARVLSVEEGMIVAHLYVDVGDAMGATLVDTVAEAVAPRLAEISGGTIGLRILTNLPLRRRVRVRAEVSAEALGSEALADGVASASRFAELDVFRAATHNKGIMNGVDAAAVALAQDWRALEAGAHAYAAIEGRYRPLAVWRRTPRGLLGTLEMPMAVATIGGSTRAHAGYRAAFELLGVTDARDLAVVLGAVGLASNLAALRALAGEGIQAGHMKLHARKAEEAEAPAAAREGRRS